MCTLNQDYYIPPLFATLLLLWCGVMKGRCIDGHDIDTSQCDAYITHPSNEISCYKAFDVLSNWTNAQDTCTRSGGGHVVSVTSPEEHHTLVKLLDTQEIDNIWIGAVEEPGTWRWPDGREVFDQGCFHDDSGDSDFPENFYLGHNNRQVCEDKCAELDYKYGGLQNKHSCMCGNSFGKHGISLMCSILCPDKSAFCGGVSSSSVFSVGGTYSHWAPGLPNNHFGYQTCAELETGNGFFWNDAKCNEVRGVICQTTDENICLMSNSTTTAAATTIISHPNSTLCYYVVTAETLTWFEARSFCQRELVGGDLPVIDSEEVDNLIVEALMKLDLNGSNYVAGFWFALTRSPWTWLSGEEFVYTSWSNGEPNGDGQHCVSMNKEGEWQDRGCADVWRTVCERDTRIKPTTTESTTDSTSTTSPVPTTTTLRLAPVRDTPRGSVYPLEDRYLAAIIAGGVVMLIVIVVATAIHCHIKCKHRAKQKEEAKDDKRVKYFFGFEGPAAEEAAAANSLPLTPPNNLLTDIESPGTTSTGEVPPGTTRLSDRSSSTSSVDVGIGIGQKDSSKRNSGDNNNESKSSRDSYENRKRLSGRLSDRPDVIPDTS